MEVLTATPSTVRVPCEGGPRFGSPRVATSLDGTSHLSHGRPHTRPVRTDGCTVLRIRVAAFRIARCVARAVSVNPLVLRFAWRVQQSPPYPRHVVPFSGAIEPGDYGPDDVELIGNMYVPSGHGQSSVCTSSRTSAALT